MYLAVVKTMEETEELANEAVVIVNEDKTRTPYPVQAQALVNEFSDVFPMGFLAILPPQRQVDHYIELVSGAEPPHRAPYHISP